MNNRNHSFKIIFSLLLLLIALPLSGCVRAVCSYCGEEKFCKEFDILGVKRNICSDCLSNPAIGLSGNVVRDYSTAYENGLLDYPANSPMRPATEAPPAEVSENRPTVDELLASPTRREDQAFTGPYNSMRTGSSNAASQPEGGPVPGGDQPGQSGQPPAAQEQGSSQPPIRPENNNNQPPTEQQLPAEQQPNGQEQPVAEQQPAEQQPSEQEQQPVQPTVSSLGDNVPDPVSDLDMFLAADGWCLSPKSDSSGEYFVNSNGSDINIRVTSIGNAIKIDQYPGASSSDYVKVVIRAILAASGSSDYDGYGHEVYNNTIQSGSYVRDNINYSTVNHTPEEVEKGSSMTSFTIMRQ